MTTYTYTTIDDPSANNGTFLQSINAWGQITGSYYDGNSISHGFLYSGGIYTTIDFPSNILGTGTFPLSINTYPLSINASGQIAGYYQVSSSEYHGFLYSG